MIYEEIWKEIYTKRDLRLQGSDWTQFPDSPLTVEKRAEWAVYRQALRDISLKWPKGVDKQNVNPLATRNIFPTKPQ